MISKITLRRRRFDVDLTERNEILIQQHFVSSVDFTNYAHRHIQRTHTTMRITLNTDNLRKQIESKILVDTILLVAVVSVWLAGRR